MKILCLAALLLAQLATAEDTQFPPEAAATPLAARPPRAWLGLSLEKPDETITAHIPNLPQGIGFVVKAVEPDGPADTAGLHELDLVWKLDDQMLVNVAQLATLLRLHHPGDPIAVSVFRGGKPLEINLTLGEAPLRKTPFSGELVESAILPGACAGPMRVVDVAGKSATFSDELGTGVVRRAGDGYHVRILGPKDEPLFDGEIASATKSDQIPEAWRRKIHVLCRSLDQALAGKLEDLRQPRPRVIPAAAANQ